VNDKGSANLLIEGVGKRFGEVVALDRVSLQGAKGELLIPMVEGICVSVDPAAKVIVVDPPEGLLEL